MQNTENLKPILATLSGNHLAHPPIWLMRQAGRYLPEYREVRAKAGSFLNLVYNPELAAEVTLQPLRRYNLDAAILFSDILVVPDALGQALNFTAGEGPKLDPIRDVQSLTKISMAQFEEKTAPVYRTVTRIREKLREEGFDDTALIGFAGSPWTVACYMVEGGGSRDFIETKRWVYSDPKGFATLIDLLVEATSLYLVRQIEAGAEIIQLFDSWAGVLEETQFQKWVIEPTQRICDRIRSAFPDIPIIGFPRAAGIMYQDYMEKSGVTALSLDQYVPVSWAAKNLQPKMPIQGNLDPVCLLTGGDALVRSVEQIQNTFGGGPYIFNLGHGIIKETPPEHVEQLIKLVRA